MANLVLAFASSHGPTMNTPPEQWRALGERDVSDGRYDFASLRPKPDIEQEITLEKSRERYDAVRRGVQSLNEVLHDASPDVIVVFSNPHGGVVTDRMQPTFAIHLNDAPPMTQPQWTNRASGQTLEGNAQPAGLREEMQYPTDGELARHLMEGLIEEGIDVAANFQSHPGKGLDGAFNLLYQQFDREARIPYVPVAISRFLPNQATPRRVYEFGQAVRRVIDRWASPKRVAVMGSGGLSHQIIDEELDRGVIAALEKGDTKAIFSIDRGRLNGAPGTPETLNWLACAGVMAPKTMTLIDYLPCYRSLKGTGHGNTFGYWR